MNGSEIIAELLKFTKRAYFQDHMFAGVQERQNAHGAGAPRAIDAEGGNRPSVRIVAVYNFLNRSLKFRHAFLPIPIKTA